MDNRIEHIERILVNDNTIQWIQHVLSIHFHPDKGSSFWLSRLKNLDFNPLKDINTLSDLKKFSIMKDKHLSGQPLWDFIPKKFWNKKTTLITGESAGTGGIIKRTAYSPQEFQNAFVNNFVQVARQRNFPQDSEWLFLGPSGPHIIAKASRACARAMGSLEPFTVDFDPRWYGKLVEDSIPRKRYAEHIVSQAIDIINVQNIEVIFATPKILSVLSERLSNEKRKRIKGIHFGGMALAPELYKWLKEEIFTEAVFISGYGNTLFGVSLELKFDPNYDITYFPFGQRLIFDVVDEKNHNISLNDGQLGRMMFSRFDETFLIINFLERDIVIKVNKSSKLEDVSGCPIMNPRPANIMYDIKAGIY